jgi:hypothetical protein
MRSVEKMPEAAVPINPIMKKPVWGNPIPAFS